MRLAVAGLVCVAGYFSITQTLAVVMASARPGDAYDLVSNNGRIAARLSQQLSGPEATDADRVRAAEVARSALIDDPIAVEAVATLGMDAIIRGDQKSARRAFSYSQMLSKRDLRTQLWAIEDAVAREDIDNALTHYDIALRTKRSAPNLLYPVLTDAIVDPAVQSSLVKVMAGKPAWGPGFINFAVNNSASPLAVAVLIDRLRPLDFGVSAGSRATAINRLISVGLIEEAWAFYRNGQKGAVKSESRDPQFTLRVEVPSQFDWVASNGPGISVAIQSHPNQGVLDFSAAPSAGGMLVKQLQLLPPGEYILEGRSIGIDQPERSMPYWIIHCHKGKELGRINVPNSSVNNGNFSGRIFVPQNCPVQQLALMARSSTDVSGVSGQFERIFVRPER